MIRVVAIAILFHFTCIKALTAFVRVSAPSRKTSLHSQKQQETQHVGVAPILQQLECGDSILGFRNSENGLHNVTVERISVSPPIFVLRNFVTLEECDSIQSSATNMEPAQTASGLQEESMRKKSVVA